MDYALITRQEAFEQGKKRYFTGKPCSKGHVSERYVSIGSCCECQTGYTEQYRAPAKEAARREISDRLIPVDLMAPVGHAHLLAKFAEGLLFADHNSRALPTAEQAFSWAAGTLPPPVITTVANTTELPHTGPCMETHTDLPRWKVRIDYHKDAYAIENPGAPHILQVWTRPNSPPRTWHLLRTVSREELLASNGKISAEGQRPGLAAPEQSDFQKMVSAVGSEITARDLLYHQHREAPEATGLYADYYNLVSAVGREEADAACDAAEAAGDRIARPDENRPLNDDRSTY